MSYTCSSVPGGWQTQVVETGELIGPAFHRTPDLWNWQRDNLHKPIVSRQYKVLWIIDIDADSPREAAEMALAIQRDPDSTALCFHVEGEVIDLYSNVPPGYTADELDRDNPYLQWMKGES